MGQRVKAPWNQSNPHELRHAKQLSQDQASHRRLEPAKALQLLRK